MDLANHIGARQRQQVIVAGKKLLAIREALTAKVCFGQFVGLDHGAHGAIQYQNPTLQGVKKALFGKYVWHHELSCFDRNEVGDRAVALEKARSLSEVIQCSMLRSEHSSAQAHVIPKQFSRLFILLQT